MIVAPCFPDDDLDIGWRQHDVYREALETLVLQTNRYARMARALLQDDTYARWGTVVRVDNRTLQGAHDLLAAAWRWQYLNPELAFEDRKNQDLESSWLKWLDQEVASWIDAPRLVRLVQIILSHQNEDVGYAAETALGLALVERFPGVAWMDQIVTALREDSRKFPIGILEHPIGLSTKPICRYNAYTFPLSPRDER